MSRYIETEYVLFKGLHMFPVSMLPTTSGIFVNVGCD